MIRKLLAGALLALLGACAVPPAGVAPGPVRFSSLPGWDTDRLSEALLSFRRSCARLAGLDPDASLGGMPDGTPVLAASTKVGTWAPVCAAAEALPDGDDAAARRFFEKFLEAHPLSEGPFGRSLFTGYYEPEVAGSRRRGGVYQTPLYRRPANLVQAPTGPDPLGERVRQRANGDAAPLPARAEIVRGALHGKGLELVWLADPVDAFFLQIQGSGRVELPGGGVMRVGYAGTNGHSYVAIGRELVDRGLMELEQVTMQSIRAWLKAHPGQAEEIMNANPSYVFFREISDVPAELGAIGSLGVPLTPGRSLAVDREYIGLGMPVFVATSDPVDASPLQRLFMAQDTGGAIKGPVRADIFFGWGPDAAERAGLMKGDGSAWVLLPRLKPL